jgi:hypothetical protein
MTFTWTVTVGGEIVAGGDPHELVPWRDLLTPEDFASRIAEPLAQLVTGITITTESGAISMDMSDEAADEVHRQFEGDDGDEVEIRLSINNLLRHHLRWRRMEFPLPIETEGWPDPVPDDWARPPPHVGGPDGTPDETATPPALEPAAPPSLEPANLFIEGAEMSRFQAGRQGQVRKHFVGSLVMDSETGGAILPRPYHAPFAWRNWSSHEITTLNAWLEDDEGYVLLFDPDARMVAEITWRAWVRDSPETADDLEGTVVVTFDGNAGSWNMGGTLDFSGVTRAGEKPPPTYEVAVLSATMTMASGDPAPGAWVVTAQYLLLNKSNGNLLVMPCGPVDVNVYIFELPVPRYERIRVVPMDQTRFKVHPAYLHETPPPPPPHTIQATKLVLRIRRCRTKLVRE